MNNKLSLDEIRKEAIEKCGLDDFIFGEDARDDGDNIRYKRFFATKAFGARTYHVYGVWTLSGMACILSELIEQLKAEFDEAEKQVTHDVQ